MKAFPLSKPLLLLSVILIPALLALACGDDEEAVEGTPTEEATAAEEGELFVDPDAPVVDVALGEFFVRPAQASAAAGGVTFDTSNEGEIEHELVVIKTDTPADQLPVTGGKVDEDAIGETIGEIEPEDLPAGGQAAATFDLEAGDYALICNVTGHYEGGMYAAFTVE